MTQLALVHETINDALGAAISFLGGPKKVGAAMRPDQPLDHAAQWVRDCLNVTRREKFSPEQVIWLLREARAAGFHGAMAFIAAECGYADPQPLEPEDEKAELQRAFMEAVRQQSEIIRRLERLGISSVRSVA